MKKFIFILALILTVSLNGQIVFQSDFETWTAGMPDGWGGSQTNIGAGNYQQYTTSAQSGTSSCQLINNTSTHKRFTTQALPIVSGQSYDITFWVRGQGEIRTGLYNGVDATQNVYQSYINVNSSSWTMQKQTLVSGQTNNNGQFIFSLRNTNSGQDHIQIDNIKIEFSTTTFDTIAIYDIQYTTDPSGDSPYLNQIIYTYGVVTAKGSAGFFIQNGTGPWSGLYIYNNTFSVNPGDSVLVLGKIEEYFNMTEMTQVTACLVLGQAQIPAPAVITTAQVNTEEYESVFVRVINAECTNVNAGFGMWTVNDGSGAALVDKLFFEFVPTLGTNYNVTGPVMYSFSAFKIEPRSASDIEIYTDVSEHFMSDIYVYPNPATDVVTINLQDRMNLQISNILGQIVYTVSHAENTVSLNVSEWKSGMYLVTFSDVSGERFSYKLLKQ